MTRTPKHPWEDSDVVRLVELRDVENLPWKEIDHLLKRPEGACSMKYYALRCKKRRPEHSAATAESPIGQRIHISVTQEAARRERRDAENRMSPAAALLGDPPPGFSALDRKNSGMQR